MQIKRKINGVRWTFKIITPDEMKEHSEGAANAGLTVASEKTVYIENEEVNYGIIMHELCHVYISNLYVDDTTELKIGDFEEMICAMLADRGEEIIRKAKKITKELKKLQEGK